MKNPILSYFCQRQVGPGVPSTTHATDGDMTRTLCGRPVPLNSDLESLRDAGGAVTCQTCSRVLKKRKVHDAYIGPTSFLPSNSMVIDGLVLREFGWGGLDRGFESFFAYGHTQPGKLLEVARQLVCNDLPGWEEHCISVHEYWVSAPALDDGQICHLQYGWTPELEDDYFTLHRSRPLNVTVLRHEAWELVEPDKADLRRETEYQVRKVKDWYRGARQLGRLATPHDMEATYLPGYTVVGIPPGESEELCLEWPTSNFEEAMESIDLHEQRGATSLTLAGDGCSIGLEALKGDAGMIIRYGIRKHGPDVAFHQFLDWYEVGGQTEGSLA